MNLNLKMNSNSKANLNEFFVLGTTVSLNVGFFFFFKIKCASCFGTILAVHVIFFLGGMQYSYFNACVSLDNH